MSEVLPRLSRAHVVVATLIAALTAIGFGSVAAAHTDFESSSPTDGAVVDGPLSTVTVDFTNPAEPAGEGFELLDPTGAIRTPTTVDPTDGTSFVLTFDPPLSGGTYGVRWKVRAGDAHPIDGSFRFEVTEPAPATTEPAAADAAPSDTVAPPAAAPAATSGASLDEFLSADSGGGDTAAVGRIGRTMTILGMIFGVGVLASLVWTIRGRRDELAAQITWIRLAGLVVFTGGFIEFAALVEGDSVAGLGDLLSTNAGVAMTLKMAGGLAVAVGFHERAGRIVAPAHSLSAAVATDLVPDATPGGSATASGRHDEGEHRWSPSTSAAVGLVGYAVVLASFWFDGHTVSKGPRAIHSLVNLVHLGAAAVWGGGVFAMTTVAWMRRRRSERSGLAAMVIRFSTLATVSLAAVIGAGLVMTWMILDSPGELVGTQWGRVLLAKTAAVGVAASMGAYNHFKLRPALERRPDDPTLARELRISLAAESAVFVVIVVLTALLVAAAT